MPELYNLEDIEYTINGEIPLTESVDAPTWTKDYKEGYIDGLKRALELIKEIDNA